MKCASSSLGRPLLLAAATTNAMADQILPLRPSSLTQRRPPLPEQRPHFPIFLEVSRSALFPLSATLFFWPPPPPMLWLTGSFLSDHHPQPITILLCLNSALTSPIFPKVSRSVSSSSSSSRHCSDCCGRRDSSYPTIIPYPSPSFSTQIAPSIPQFFPRFPKVHLFLSWPSSSSSHCRHYCGRPDPSSPTTIPDPSPSSSTRTTPSPLATAVSSSSEVPSSLSFLISTVGDNVATSRCPLFQPSLVVNAIKSSQPIPQAELFTGPPSHTEMLLGIPN